MYEKTYSGFFGGQAKKMDWLGQFPNGHKNDKNHNAQNHSIQMRNTQNGNNRMRRRFDVLLWCLRLWACRALKLSPMSDMSVGDRKLSVNWSTNDSIQPKVPASSDLLSACVKRGRFSSTYNVQPCRGKGADLFSEPKLSVGNPFT